MAIGNAIGIPFMQAKAKKYILDKISGSVAAYSTRLLKASFIGQNVVEVRRSGDNAILGFKANEITDGTLAAWANAGTGDGFVATWYDQSGEGNDAEQDTANDQPQIVAGGVVQDIEYDGTNDYFDVADSPELRINEDMTISLWFKMVDVTQGSQVLITKDLTNEFEVLYHSENRIVLYQGGDYMSFYPNLSNNVWYHLVISRNTAENKVYWYLDGGATTDIINYSTIIGTSFDDIHIGSRGADKYFNGSISNVLIFDEALSEAEIELIYNEGK